MQTKKQYLCVDLKSFYASVECVERGLDPMTADLAVADAGRTERTVCLAVSPSLKAKGVPGRCRVYQIPKEISYIMAAPRMRLYMEYSAQIYSIYLNYVSEEDLHVYSIDEVFIDATAYLSLYRMTAEQLAGKILEDIRKTTGIPAAAGIGENLYLAKIALDLIAKRTKKGIGVLDETAYKKFLWEHRPLTDFWRIGPGISRRLENIGVKTMKQLAQIDEKILYRMFGADAELLIDHAWGKESATLADIKEYQPKTRSISSRQTLPRGYRRQEGEMIVKEMTDALCLELIEKGCLTNSITLCVGYEGKEEKEDVCKTVHLAAPSDGAAQMIKCAVNLYRKTADMDAVIRRIGLTFSSIQKIRWRQYDLFTSPQKAEKEYQIQKAALDIKKKFGKNAILKGMDLQDGATAMERNCQIGGHKSGV